MANINRIYELVIVLAGDATSAKAKAVEASIRKIVNAVGGKVVGVEDWGKKDLVYKIQSQSSGSFYIYSLELEDSSAKHIHDKIRLEQDVIRYLLISKLVGKVSKLVGKVSKLAAGAVRNNNGKKS